MTPAARRRINMAPGSDAYSVSIKGKCGSAVIFDRLKRINLSQQLRLIAQSCADDVKVGYTFKQLESMSIPLLGEKKKKEKKKKNPDLPTLFFWARYANITFFFFGLSRKSRNLTCCHSYS